jgi:Mn-dependent DtxR family transcriptional regulator
MNDEPTLDEVQETLDKLEADGLVTKDAHGGYTLTELGWAAIRMDATPVEELN